MATFGETDGPVCELRNGSATQTKTLCLDDNGDMDLDGQRILTEAQAIPSVQARRSTNITYVLSTFTDITFNVTDVENDATVVEHNNTNTNRIDIKETGLYEVGYLLPFNVANGGTSADPYLDSRVRVNDTTVVDASEDRKGNHYSGSGVVFEPTSNSSVFLVELTAGDYITLQAKYEDSVTTADSNTRDAHFFVKKLQGTKGDTGETGAGANIIVQKDDVTVGTVTDSLNFKGDSIKAVVDEGANKTTVTISSPVETIITPAQITANQNDYNPTGFSTINRGYLRGSADAKRDITGFASQGSGFRFYYLNIGPGNVKFKNNSILSAVGNRILLDADLTLAENQSAEFWEDIISGAWRLINDQIN